MMKSDLPNETIKPAYPLGDANAAPPAPQHEQSERGKKDVPTQPAPKTEPTKVDEPQTDGE